MAAINLTSTALIQDAILGLNLLTGSLTGDVVGVYNQQSFQQLFANARPLKAFIRETSRIMEHPIESGAMIGDHKVIDPRTIELLLLIDSKFYSSSFQQIRSAWLNNTLLTVQTKAAVYSNMVIKDLPREEDPEKFDVTIVSLQMKEIIFALPNSVSSTSSVSYYSPTSPSNQSIIARGLQSSLLPASASLLSFAHAASVWGIN